MIPSLFQFSLSVRTLWKKNHSHVPRALKFYTWRQTLPRPCHLSFVWIWGTFIFCALIEDHECLSSLVTNNQSLCLTVVSFFGVIIMVGAKEELCAVALLFPILAVVSLAQSHGSYSTWFSFPSFGNDDSSQLKYMGNASCSSSGGYIDLTPSPNTTSGTSHEYSDMYNCVGRVLYREPIKVWPATFTTTFTDRKSVV